MSPESGMKKKQETFISRHFKQLQCTYFMTAPSLGIETMTPAPFGTRSTNRAS